MTLHIYAQVCWHQEAYIVGTTEALTELRNAIDIALAGNEVKMEAMTSDGEGYDIHIILLNDAETWRNLELPYTDPDASWKHGDDILLPSDLVDWPNLPLDGAK